VKINYQKQSRGLYHAKLKLKLSEFDQLFENKLLFFKIGSFSASWRHFQKNKTHPKTNKLKPN